MVCVEAKQLSSKELSVRIASIPNQDKKILSDFFKRLFYHSDFSYALLDAKPMGSIDYNQSLLGSPQFYKNPENHLFLMARDQKGWKIWKRYQHRFPMKKYSFIKIENEASFGFLLINQKKTHDIIGENLPLFQDFIGKKICANKILQLICGGKFGYYHSNATCPLTYYEALGLLFGYGEENVQAFTKRAQLLQNLGSLPIQIGICSPTIMNYLDTEVTQQTCAKCQPKHIKEIRQLASELDNIICTTHLLPGTKTYNPLLPAKRSLFLGNETAPQTLDIIENYEKLNKEILNIYKSSNFLETILTILTSS